ncbi:helix-turn-helix domain-containing protein [Nitriliruptor alkaliphilus]|uniref:helix-turn-helix domain-containing protein n=1 Tax=Nitriliruptor alkaliphilus TaxID=427918 RepID=UPI001B8009AA|nr:XRE family transcriptional regulator [Nitriliruptor alkaliphilus]
MDRTDGAAEDPADAAQLRERVAASVRERRLRDGRSLAELASAAGIGKSTLHAIETGDANPSIETIWALARALAVPFGDLLDPPAPAVRVVRAGEGPRIDAAEGAGMVAHLVATTGCGARTEWYVVDVAVGESPPRDGHTTGTVEHVYVVAGTLRVGPDAAPIDLEAGDLATFPGDVTHRYEALAEGTRALLLVEYP